jgi:hypothetical protein
MVTRRGLLLSLAAVAVGGGAYATNDTVKSEVDEVGSSVVGEASGPPSTENMIDSMEGPKRDAVSDEGEIVQQYTSLVKKVEFYESGAAKIYPTANHSCYDALAFKHTLTNLPRGSDGEVDTSEALRTWSLGEFDETLTVDMAGAISEKSNYPNSKFELLAVSNSGPCFSVGLNEEATVSVPDAFLP